MANSVTSARSVLGRPEGIRSVNWTVVTDDEVVVGGSVPDRVAAERLLARADEFSPASDDLDAVGSEEVAEPVDRLVVDPRAPRALGALVVRVEDAFAADGSLLTAGLAALHGIPGRWWRFDEVAVVLEPGAGASAISAGRRRDHVEAQLEGLGCAAAAIETDPVSHRITVRLDRTGF